MNSADGSADRGPSRADLGGLADRALDIASNIARRGSTLTTGVAIVAAFVAGLTLLVGLAALDDTARSVWLVAGSAVLVVAVGAPLLASFRLRAIPKHAKGAATELRSLLNHSDEARQAIVDTVARDEAGDAGATQRARGPQVANQIDFARLRRLVKTPGDFQNLVKTFESLGSFPALVVISVVATCLAAVLGFVLVLVWIF